jgi:hypothetical protein
LTHILLLGWVQLEVVGQLLLRVQPVRKVDPAEAAVGVHLHAQRLLVVGAVGAARELGQVELDLVPAVIQPHRHRADERLHPGGGQVVAGAEAAPHVLVVQHQHLEREELLHVLDDHHEEGQTHAQRVSRLGRARDVASVDVASADVQHQRLDVLVHHALHLAAALRLGPNLQRAAADAVEDGQEVFLERVFEHFAALPRRRRIHPACENIRTRQSPVAGLKICEV